jgi:GTP-binding protein Era
MIELTYDRDARTLYCYFADIAEGEDVSQVNVDGEFFLDDVGQLIGLNFATGGVLFADTLRFATGHPEVEYVEETGDLTIWFERQQPGERIELPFPAIFDLARNGAALGVEVYAEPEFKLGERLQYADPFVVEIYDSAEVDEADEVDVDTAAAEAEVGAPSDGVPVSEVGTTEGEAAPAALAEVDRQELVRVGFVALLGKPNVGKSTLLNAYLGQKVSIVSPKPQTTRVPVRGILNREDAQVIFVDTPGLHTPRSGLGEYMVQAARRAIPDSDVLCFVVDATEPPSALDEQIAQMIKRSGKPSLLVLNKVDVARKADVYLQQYHELGPWDEEVAVSAKTTDGLAGLLDEIIQRLPEGPRLFPAEQITDLSQREQVAELIREKVLLNTSEEVPHGIAVEVEEWEQHGKRLYIRATVNVEREGHKAILIGEGGAMLKKIGAAARYEIERLLEEPVYLDLWVKVRKDWRRNPASLRWLGYDLKNVK